MHVADCAQPRRILQPMTLSGIFLFHDLLALLAGLGQADGDCLFAAFHLLARAAAFQGALLALFHHLFDFFRSAFGIFPCHDFTLWLFGTSDLTSEIKFGSGKERRFMCGVAIRSYWQVRGFRHDDHALSSLLRRCHCSHGGR